MTENEKFTNQHEKKILQCKHTETHKKTRH